MGFSLFSRTTVNVLKFQTLFSYVLNAMLFIWAGAHKMLVRKENREDPDQIGFSEAV